MAQITWQNVAAPDFSTALQGLGQFGKFFDSATSSLKTGVNAFDQSKSDLLNNQIALARAQTPDAATFQKAVAAGQLGGIDFTSPDVQRRISAANLTAMSPESIAKLSTDQTSAAKMLSDFTQNQAMDAQGALIARARQARTNNDLETANKLDGQIDWSKTGFKNLEDYFTNGQRIDSNQISNDKAGFERDLSKRSDTIDTVAQNLAQQIIPKGETPEERAYLARELLRPHENDPNFGRLSARVNELIGGAGGGMGGGGGGGSPGTAIGGGGGGTLGTRTGDPASVVFGFGQYGTPPRPLGDMSIAEASDWSNTLGNATKAQGIGIMDGKVVGTSALGPFQIEGRSTLVKYAKKMGLDPNTTKFDLSTQDKIAEQIFNDNKGGNLKQTWTSLPDATPGAYKNKSWSDVRDIIMRGEAGVDWKTAQANAVAVQSASGVEAGAQDPTGLAAVLLEKARSRRDPAVVSKEMATAFGMTEPDANNAIRMIMDRGRALKTELTPDQAVEIFKRSRQGEGVGDALGGWLFANNRAGPGMRTRNGMIDEAIKTYASPQAQQQVVRDAERSRLEGINQGNLAGFQAAYQNYIRATNASVNNKDYSPVLLERARTQLVRAGQMANVASGDLEKFLNPQYFGDPSLISNLRVGNDKNTKAAEIIAQRAQPPAPANNAAAIQIAAAAQRQRELAGRAPDLLGTRR